MNWRHALDIKARPYEYTAADRALLEAVAGKIVDLGFSMPAVLLLESTAPLNFIGSQMMLFLAPVVHAFFTGQTWDHFQRLLEHRTTVRELVIHIERLQREREAG